MKETIINGLTVLEPSDSTHLKQIETGDIFEGSIYLGIFDKVENYIEVSEEEYQEWLKRCVDIENEPYTYEETNELIEKEDEIV